MAGNGDVQPVTGCGERDLHRGWQDPQDLGDAEVRGRLGPRVEAQTACRRVDHELAQAGPPQQ